MKPETLKKINKEIEMRKRLAWLQTTLAEMEAREEARGSEFWALVREESWLKMKMFFMERRRNNETDL